MATWCPVSREAEVKIAAPLAALAVFAAACGAARPAPTGSTAPTERTAPTVPGRIATIAQYAAIITRYGLPLRADATALTGCDPAAPSPACADRARRAATHAGALAAALDAANLSGSASYVGAPPHPIAGLVADTRYDAHRLSAAAADRPVLTSALSDLVLELDAWEPFIRAAGGGR
jgi:hypothetical protein